MEVCEGMPAELEVTPTFAPLKRNTWSQAQTHKKSMDLVNFCLGPGHDCQAATDAADVCY